MRQWLTGGIAAFLLALMTLAGPARAQNSTNNRTPVACSALSTITTGGTAQTLIAANTGVGGFVIMNTDSTTGSGEPLWISFTTTAAPDTVNSFPLAAPTATTFAGPVSFYSPVGFNHAISIIGATTGHKFSCTRW